MFGASQKLVETLTVPKLRKGCGDFAIQFRLFAWNQVSGIAEGFLEFHETVWTNVLKDRLAALGADSIVVKTFQSNDGNQSAAIALNQVRSLVESKGFVEVVRGECNAHLLKKANELANKERIERIGVARRAGSIIQQKDTVIEKKDAIIERKDALIEKKSEELEKKDAIIEKKRGELERKDAIIERKSEELEKKDAIIEKKDKKLKKNDAIIEKKNEELKKKDQEIEILRNRLETFRAEERASVAGACEILEFMRDSHGCLKRKEPEPYSFGKI